MNSFDIILFSWIVDSFWWHFGSTIPMHLLILLVCALANPLKELKGTCAPGRTAKSRRCSLWKDGSPFSTISAMIRMTYFWFCLSTSIHCTAVRLITWPARVQKGTCLRSFRRCIPEKSGKCRNDSVRSTRRLQWTSPPLSMRWRLRGHSVSLILLVTPEEVVKFLQRERYKLQGDGKASK